MDPGYKKTITPVPDDDTDGDLCVNVSLSILDILQIDEMKETFTAKISLRREWMDRRLTYKNLKRENSNKNDLSTEEAESIWYPSVSINNVENKEKVKPTDIENHARVIPDQNFSYTYKDNRHFFKGSENKLTLTKQWTVEFVCHYELHWYPFDTQVIFPFTHILFKTLRLAEWSLSKERTSRSCSLSSWTSTRTSLLAATRSTTSRCASPWLATPRASSWRSAWAGPLSATSSPSSSPPSPWCPSASYRGSLSRTTLIWLSKSTSPYFLSWQLCEFSLFFSTNLSTQLSWALPDLASDLLREDARHLVDLHHDRPLHRGRHACLQPAPQKANKGRSNNDFNEDRFRDSFLWNIVSRSPSYRLCPFLCWILDPWLSGFPLVGQSVIKITLISSYSHPSTS